MAAPTKEEVPASRGTGRTATATVLLGTLEASSPASWIIYPRPAPEGSGEAVVSFIGDDSLPHRESTKTEPDRLDDPADSALYGSGDGSHAIVGDAGEDTFVLPAFGGGAAADSRTGTEGAARLASAPVPLGDDSFVFNAAGIGEAPVYLATGGPGHIQAERIATGLALPVFAASPPGDPDRLFVLEKDTGRVLILDLTTNQVLAQPFFDVPDAEMTNNGERGLLGLAFHPGYAANGKLYLDFFNDTATTEIWELTRSTDPNRADPASQRVLLTVPRDPANSNHNGGWIGFGPDGLLYIATGDGGSGNDPTNNAQNVNDLRGKMLRIDVDSDAFPADPGRNYAIPPGNPFVGVNGADEVFAYGLRNPFRASFDSRTGDFYIADVGQNAREEIDFLAAGTGAGTNFGWRVMEGTLPTGLPQLGNPPPGDPSLRPPVFEYGSELSGPSRAVTGGYVYHGPGGGQGLYFFADFVNDKIWTLRVENGQAVDFALRNEQIATSAGTLDQIASFAVDGRERLYAIGLDGEIFRLTPSEDFGAGTAEQGGTGGDDDSLEFIVGVGLVLAAASFFF